MQLFVFQRKGVREKISIIYKKWGMNSIKKIIIKTVEEYVKKILYTIQNPSKSADINPLL